MSNVASDLCPVAARPQSSPLQALTSPRGPPGPLPGGASCGPLGCSHSGEHCGQSRSSSEKPGEGKSMPLPKGFPGSFRSLSNPLPLACPQACPRYVSLRSCLNTDPSTCLFPRAAPLSGWVTVGPDVRDKDVRTQVHFWSRLQGLRHFILCHLGPWAWESGRSEF